MGTRREGDYRDRKSGPKREGSGVNAVKMHTLLKSIVWVKSSDIVNIKQNKPTYDNKNEVRAYQSGLDLSSGRGNLCSGDT